MHRPASEHLCSGLVVVRRLRLADDRGQTEADEPGQYRSQTTVRYVSRGEDGFPV
jgi:hypothetical protein